MEQLSPALPALARRLLTVSLRAGAAQKIVELIKDNARRTRLALLSAEKYTDMRCNAVKAVANLPDGHSGAAHHLPGGGNYKQGFCWLPTSQSLVYEITREPSLEGYDLPPYFWNSDSRSIGHWDCPPVRALAMIDSQARDLSAAFVLFARDCRRRQGIIFDFYFCPRARPDSISGDMVEFNCFRHDYLWFNSVAIFYGLTNLVEGLQGIIQKRKDVRHGVVHWKCMVQEHYGESRNIFTGLQIEIVQMIDASVGTDDKSAAGTIEVILPVLRNPNGGVIPQSSSQEEKKFENKINTLKGAGAIIGTFNGAIELLIPACNSVDVFGESGKNVWKVDQSMEPQRVWDAWLRRMGEFTSPEAVQTPAKYVELNQTVTICVVDVSGKSWEKRWECAIRDSVNKREVIVYHVPFEKARKIKSFDGEELGRPDFVVLHAMGRSIEAACFNYHPTIEISGGNRQSSGLPLAFLGGITNVDELYGLRWATLGERFCGDIDELCRILRNP